MTSSVSDGVLKIGGVQIDRASALDSARSYLSRRDRFGYPAYDSFGSEGGPWRVADADFVAPVLLNAEMNSRTFYALEAVRPHLEHWLADIPVDARLVEAGPVELAKLGELFSVLDSDDLPGNARGSILAKVMHRKRPAFIPLYDRFVDYCYRGADGAPVSRDRKRSWREFLPLLGQAIIDDLTTGHEFFGEVAALATTPPITSLRALDIVAWHAGRSHIGPAIWAAASPDGAPNGNASEEIPSIDPDDERP
ncbi:hypothetical protein SAMN04515671_1881 [Nakamurella panacisegetis]|uniref:Uncharacterized protein n=1 Tax=Nakamurella panacisegetis TaxID=1090615 RepID=A0A1H0M067_9ACTN|nr:DUF6308 family protein [Nakamurella panacisegetis]SDO73797.1 hypothetical protein SAMN04515671_1881 [Nakamurella panacisegetis]